jgi:hypothetical protein
LSKAHANHATGELNEQQYTEKARELLGMIGRLRNALFHKSMAWTHKTGPVLSCCKGSMTNANAIKLLSPRTRSLLRLHAEAIGVDEAKLASDLFQMMVHEAQSLQLQTASVTAATNVIPFRAAVAATGAGRWAQET